MTQTAYEITVGTSHLHGSPLRYHDWAEIETAAGTFEAVMPTRKEAVAAVAKLAVEAGAADGLWRVYNDRGDFKYRGKSLRRLATSAPPPFYIIVPLQHAQGAECSVGDLEYAVRTRDKPEAHLASGLLDAGLPDGRWVLLSAFDTVQRSGDSLLDLVAELPVDADTAQ